MCVSVGVVSFGLLLLSIRWWMWLCSWVVVFSVLMVLFIEVFI